jgi:KipI family sensor histidine kinase inhibitor
VNYGGEVGPDLEFVARHNAMTEAEVVAVHTSTRYLVHMLGFTPGFPYLGGMSERIAAPRLEVPRIKVPAGCRICRDSGKADWNLSDRKSRRMAADWAHSGEAF